jgi:hypothetical protein
MAKYGQEHSPHDIKRSKEMHIADIKYVSWMRYYKYMWYIKQEHKCASITILHVRPYWQVALQSTEIQNNIRAIVWNLHHLQKWPKLMSYFFLYLLGEKVIRFNQCVNIKHSPQVKVNNPLLRIMVSFNITLQTDNRTTSMHENSIYL